MRAGGVAQANGDSTSLFDAWFSSSFYQLEVLLMFGIPQGARWAILTLVLLAPVGFAARAHGEGLVAALPRGVADPDLKVGAITSFKHTVYGVDLKSGKTVWETALDGVPVAFADRYVLVLGAVANKPNTGIVTAVEPLTGRVIWRSEPITLPDWASIAPADDHYFGHLARFKDGNLWVKWLAMARKPGGQKAINTASGVARLDLKSHKVEMLDADKMPPPDHPAQVSEKLTKLAERPVETPAGPETRVTTVGNLVVALDVDKDAITLQRWNLKTEKALDPVVLAKGRRFRATPFPEAGAVLIRPVPSGKEVLRAPVWQVFSLETGKRIAQFTVESDTMQPTILGPCLYYAFMGKADLGNPEVPNLPMVRQLRAVDLKTGTKLWNRLLEDLPWDPFGGVSGDDS
jgi:hypothetical protein